MGLLIRSPGFLSIGIAAHGNVETTAECIECLLSSVQGEFELLLVDDQSPDDMLSLYREAARHHAATSIYRFPENKEYSHSVNCILNEARGDRVLFVSNDIMITPHYVAGLIEVMQDETIGIARGVSNFVDNGLDSHNIKLDVSIEDRLQMFTLAEEIHGRSIPSADDPFLIGDAFMVSRNLLNTIGGFDTRYVGYLSDFDFGIRAVGAGFRRVFVPKAFAWHGKDANFEYLDSEGAKRKLEMRWQRIRAAWKVFRERWELHSSPPEWPGVNAVPLAELDRLAALRSDLEVTPISYDAFRVPVDRASS